MLKGGTVRQFCFLHSMLVYAIKVGIAVLIIFMFLECSLNLLAFKETTNKIVFPGLAWISSSLNNKMPLLGRKESCTRICKGIIINNSLIALSDVSQPEISSNTSSVDTTGLKVALHKCPPVPPKLVGRLNISFESPPFEILESLFHDLQPGGRYKPPECISRHKVAIIVPFRDREEHLRIFLHNLHPILQRQQLDYGIYFIEQSGGEKFNRGMLMNIGFVEAQKQYNYDCFVFHDVDLIPEDDRNLYTCSCQPRHMAVGVDTLGYRLRYPAIFGGVSALTREHMETVNGFSNEFWGWGGEDDDLSNRITYHGLEIFRCSSEFDRYTMLKHKKAYRNPSRFNLVRNGKHRFLNDGLSNLEYKRPNLDLKKLYSRVLAEI